MNSNRSGGTSSPVESAATGLEPSAGKILAARHFLYQTPRCTKGAMSCRARYRWLFSVAAAVLSAALVPVSAGSTQRGESVVLFEWNRAE